MPRAPGDAQLLVDAVRWYRNASNCIPLDISMFPAKKCCLFIRYVLARSTKQGTTSKTGFFSPQNTYIGHLRITWTSRAKCGMSFVILYSDPYFILPHPCCMEFHPTFWLCCNFFQPYMKAMLAVTRQVCSNSLKSAWALLKSKWK